MEVYATAAEFAALTIPEPPWAIPGIVGASGVTLLHGHPKLGKSTLALQLALALSGGTAFLRPEWLPLRRWRVVYVMADAADKKEWHTQVKQLAAAGVFGLINEVAWGGLWTEAEALRRELARLHAEYVVWDSAFKLVPAHVKLTEGEGIKALMQRLEAAFKGPGMLVAHDRKGVPGFPDDPVLSVAGHHTFTAAVSGTWHLGGQETKATLQYKQRLAPGGKQTLVRHEGRWVVPGADAPTPAMMSCGGGEDDPLSRPAL